MSHPTAKKRKKKKRDARGRWNFSDLRRTRVPLLAGFISEDGSIYCSTLPSRLLHCACPKLHIITHSHPRHNRDRKRHVGSNLVPTPTAPTHRIDPIKNHEGFMTIRGKRQRGGEKTPCTTV